MAYSKASFKQWWSFRRGNVAGKYLRTGFLWTQVKQAK